MSTALVRRSSGPMHERMDSGLTRCGRKLGRYLDSSWHDGEPEDITCTKCASLRVKGERRSWRSGR